jgi:hypothetical protein
MPLYTLIETTVAMQLDIRLDGSWAPQTAASDSGPTESVPWFDTHTLSSLPSELAYITCKQHIQ